jgi:hypothetical protein
VRGGLAEPGAQQVEFQRQCAYPAPQRMRLLLAGAFEEGDGGIEEADDFAKIGWRH